MLAARAASCTGCALAATRTQVVFGAGRADAPLIVVGEAPGQSEDVGGAPFVGRSGQLLRRTLEAAGLPATDWYITNAVKCRPPQNRTPRVGELAACGVWWDAQRPLLSGRVIAAVGATAARAVLGRVVRLQDDHGRAVSVQGRVVVPVYHPAAVLRNPHLAEVFRADIDEVVRRVRDE
jgi:uracil-DNA glycosylase